MSLARVGVVPEGRPRPRPEPATSTRAEKATYEETRDGRTDRSRGADCSSRAWKPQGVEHVFCIPGAKIDKVLDCLHRHDDQDRGLPARAERRPDRSGDRPDDRQGRGVPGDFSGPGCTNLATGLATADYEGDPVVAFGGAVPLADRLKLAHQSLDTVNLFRPITKLRGRDDDRARHPGSRRGRVPGRRMGGGRGRHSSRCRRT